MANSLSITAGGLMLAYLLLRLRMPPGGTASLMNLLLTETFVKDAHLPPGLAICFVLITIRERRWPHSARSWAFFMIATVAIIVAAVLTWVIDELPALSFIPPEQIVQGATGGIPNPDTTHLSAEERAMTARGRYVFTVASCAFCHNPDGSGGLKVSWRPFGTLWVRNITPDRETGIGTWSDAAIARAVRSGLTPDGRVLHWQGMIWDHASNWDEEDIRALIAYLRKIPAVRHAIPPARQPASDDCEVYTFWVSPSSSAGCR